MCLQMAVFLKYWFLCLCLPHFSFKKQYYLLDKSLILNISAIQFQEFLLIKVFKLLAQFVIKKMIKAYTSEKITLVVVAVLIKTVLETIYFMYMELWCKWSAWQESLFIAYSQTLESPHGTMIMKYFCFSLLQETFSFRACSTRNPFSLKHCRCGRLWKERAKSLASAESARLLALQPRF